MLLKHMLGVAVWGGSDRDPCTPCSELTCRASLRQALIVYLDIERDVKAFTSGP